MKNKIKAIIVDDERLARKDLQSLLNDYPYIELVGEADDAKSAIKLINKANPELIFLDIQMPGESGFDLVEKIKPNIKVIFVTAYDEYAIRAFEINALDYLLKPVNPKRLQSSIERLNSEVNESNATEFSKLEYNDRLFISVNTTYKFLNVNTIQCITSAGDYTNIQSTDGTKGLVNKSMNEWEQRLPENYFCRIHRSTIINMEFVEKTEEWFNNSYRVYLKEIENPLIISRRYVAKLKNKLG